MRFLVLLPILALAGCASFEDFFAQENVESRRLAECIAYDEVSFDARELRWEDLSPIEQSAVKSLDKRVEVYCDPDKPATVAGNAVVVTATARLMRILN